MYLLIYMLALLTSFSGLLLGILLSNIAFEEISIASKYLKWLNILLVASIIFVATHNIQLIYAIIFSLLTAVLIFIFRRRYSDVWIYSSIGALFYVALLSGELLNVSILTFVYGLSITTINAANIFKNKTNKQIKFSENLTFARKVILKYSFFLLTGIIFYLAFAIIRNI
jgi:hypothetical protein